jgi:hypothetical protein
MKSEALQGAGSQAVDHAAEALGQATALLDEGQIWRAHEKAASLPPNSNARQTGEFRRIEAAWADAMFEKAKVEPDPEVARTVLDEIAKSPSVDSLRRKRAADEIAKLDAEAVDVAELPRSPAAPPATQPLPVPTRARSATSTAATQAANGHRVGTAIPRARAPEAEAAPRIPAPAPTTRKMAASGNLAQLTAAKDSLKAKIASGSASQQEKKLLRALCRQLGDTSCAK